MKPDHSTLLVGFSPADDLEVYYIPWQSSRDKSHEVINPGDGLPTCTYIRDLNILNQWQLSTSQCSLFYSVIISLEIISSISSNADFMVTLIFLFIPLDISLEFIRDRYVLPSSLT